MQHEMLLVLALPNGDVLRGIQYACLEPVNADVTAARDGIHDEHHVPLVVAYRNARWPVRALTDPQNENILLSLDRHVNFM
jgi:hypothetical protein